MQSLPRAQMSYEVMMNARETWGVCFMEYYTMSSGNLAFLIGPEEVMTHE